MPDQHAAPGGHVPSPPTGGGQAPGPPTGNPPPPPPGDPAQTGLTTPPPQTGTPTGQQQLGQQLAKFVKRLIWWVVTALLAAFVPILFLSLTRAMLGHPSGFFTDVIDSGE